MGYTYASENVPLPKAVRGHSNGELPANILIGLPLPARGRLLKDTSARSFEAMQWAHHAETGVHLGTTSAGDAYRNRASQVAAFYRRYTPAYNPKVNTLLDTRLGPDGKRWWKRRGVAALAGFDKQGSVKSLHGWGLAADLKPVNSKWLEANAAQYGWKKSGSREPWHYFHTTGDMLTPAVVAYEKTHGIWHMAQPDLAERVAVILPLLQRGSTGPYVKAVQQAIGFTGRNVDGQFGPVTEKAVKAFQQAHNLKPNGIVDALTWAFVK